MEHHTVGDVAAELAADLDRRDPGLDAEVRAFAEGLKAAGDAVRDEGINDPVLLRAVADAVEDADPTPWDRGWGRGLRVVAGAIEDGEWT